MTETPASAPPSWSEKRWRALERLASHGDAGSGMRAFAIALEGAGICLWTPGGSFRLTEPAGHALLRDWRARAANKGLTL